MRFFCDCRSVARRTQKEYPQNKKNGSVLAQKSCKEILDVVKCIIVYYKQIKGTAPLRKGVALMATSYKRLWKLLIDRDLKKKDLEQKAGISHYVVNKLTHGENVTTDVLGRICKALDCSLDDIMEFIDE